MTQKVIFFDIDGTLLSTGGAGQKALGRALEAEFDTDSAFEGVATAGRTDRGIVEEIFRCHKIENSQQNRERFRSSYLSQLTQTLHESPGHVLSGVPELVQRCSENSDWMLGVLTGNYEQAAWDKLDHYEIKGRFRFGGFGDHHAQRDDVARNALAAAQEHLGREIVGSEMLVIGDTPADIQCARAIGAQVMAVATGGFSFVQLEQHQPDLIFEDFSDTDTVIESLLSVWNNDEA